MKALLLTSLLCLGLAHIPARGEDAAPPAVADSALAKQLGADERGMRMYVLVILKTGPQRTGRNRARSRPEVGRRHPLFILRGGNQV